MALEKTFRDLSDRLRQLRDCFLALQLTAREDQPTEGSVVLVDRFGDAVDDCMGWLEEALTLSLTAKQVVVGKGDLVGARQALAACQERFHLVERRFFTDVVSYERLEELTSFGRRRKGEWQMWVKSMRQGAGQCRQPVEDVRRELMSCWQELADRAGGPSVSVQATNIGQQITAAEAKDLMRNDMT